MPYLSTKKTGATSGIFCRGGPVSQLGSPIGPALAEMNNGDMEMTLMGASNLPRCLAINMKGSTFGISAADAALGDDNGNMEYQYELEQDTMKADDARCVFATSKPRCMAYSKPSVAFRAKKGVTCENMWYKPTCIDSCVKIHCANPEDGACGHGKAFSDCAHCCETNNNMASGCFRRRRRRLGEKGANPGYHSVLGDGEDEFVAADGEDEVGDGIVEEAVPDIDADVAAHIAKEKAAHAAIVAANGGEELESKSAKMPQVGPKILPPLKGYIVEQVTRNECATYCLNTPGCRAFNLDNNGVCTISSRCDAQRNGEPGFEKQTWEILRDLEDSDLGMSPKSDAERAAAKKAKGKAPTEIRKRKKRKQD